jgi:hypothetical protein
MSRMTNWPLEEVKLILSDLNSPVILLMLSPIKLVWEFRVNNVDGISLKEVEFF